MGRSRDDAERRRRRVLYLVPVIAVAALLLIALVTFDLPQAQPFVQNFNLEISIQLYNQNSTGGLYLQYSFPDLAVGMRGGYWISHVHDGEGSSGVSPVYSPDPRLVYPANTYPGYTTIYVRSTSNRTYTLGDYFAIWGEPLGKNNTVGYTTPPQGTAYPSTWSWHMCVGPSFGSMNAGLWGKEPLVSGMRIILAYEEQGPCGVG